MYAKRFSCFIFQFSLVQLAADGDSKESNLADVRRYCPSMQTDFWSCMNKTLSGRSMSIFMNTFKSNTAHNKSLDPLKNSIQVNVSMFHGLFEINFTLYKLSAVQRGAQWSGRICCPLATHPKCQNACATSASREELITGCRQSDEQNLFSCFDRQDVGDECCGNARTSKCLQVCYYI